MALVEATVVVYIRRILAIDPEPVDLDLTTIQHIKDHAPWLLQIEPYREAATIVMLATLGYLAADTWRERWGVFLYTFGWWDIGYYAWLRVFIDWPPSLLTSDILFLIPVPWIAPVLLPVTIAAGMVLGGAWLIRSPSGNKKSQGQTH